MGAELFWAQCFFPFLFDYALYIVTFSEKERYDTDLLKARVMLNIEYIKLASIEVSLQFY